MEGKTYSLSDLRPVALMRPVLTHSAGLDELFALHAGMLGDDGIADPLHELQQVGLLLAGRRPFGEAVEGGGDGGDGNVHVQIRVHLAVPSWELSCWSVWERNQYAFGEELRAREGHI